ncbi:choline transporter-like protein 2 [Ylistrum balloti]|uniref:choline transporter-like protein 2 n=1 Tax=Ylistrum balloti TaxID=509963 RepID=UPI002905D8A6|nr:choline transporter-like protein 2 [Ylistrum balloti]
MSKVAPEGKPKQHDPGFKGPLKKRSCTDIICCLIFLIFFGLLLLISAYAFMNGNPLLLLYPVDSEGVMCGSGVNAGKEYLFYFDIIQCAKSGIAAFLVGCPSPQICVTTCPSNYYSVLTDVQSVTDLRYCKTSADMTKDVYQLVSDDSCPAYFLASSPIIRRCVPNVLLDVLTGIGNLNENLDSSATTVLTDKDGTTLTNSILAEGLDVFGAFILAKEYAEKIMADILNTWWIIIIFMIIAMILSLIYIVLLRLMAGFIVWFTIFGMLGAFGYASFYFLMAYVDPEGDNDEMFIAIAEGGIYYSKSNMYLGLGTMEVDENYEEYFTRFVFITLCFFTAIVAMVLFVIVLVMVLFLFTRIRIAIGLMKEASRAVGGILTTLAFPILIMGLQVLVVAYFMIFAAYPFYLILMNFNRNQNTTSISDMCAYFENNEEMFVFYAAIFSLFMFFWMINFVIALGQLTLAGAFSSYYWAFEKPKDIPVFPLAAAMWRAIRYHLGSLAFGSFILAVVALIRVILEYLDHKLGGRENVVAKFVVKCLKCCFWCLEKCLKFLTKNAYIQMSIHGKNFCFSAKDAFFTIMRNILRVAVVDKVADFVLLVGKLLVIGLTEALAFYAFEYLAEYLITGYDSVTDVYILPFLIILGCSYAIASCFFDVFSMALSTLFMCFLEDIEMNDGSSEKPYFMSKELMKVIGVKNVIMSDKQKKGAGASNNF